MKNFEISLYGHLIHDTIFNGIKIHETVGGLANVWDALIQLCDHKVHIEPTEIGEALIYVDPIKSRRASKASLSLKKRIPFIRNSDWSHILYLNQLKETGFISEVSAKSKFVSADICAGSILKNVELLEHVDLLFVSDDDLWLPIEELRRVVKGDILVHHSHGSCFYRKNGDFFETVIEKILTNVNILGAGDMFAASVISNLIDGGDGSLKKAIEDSHKKTFNLIKLSNEK